MWRVLVSCLLVACGTRRSSSDDEVLKRADTLRKQVCACTTKACTVEPLLALKDLATDHNFEYEMSHKLKDRLEVAEDCEWKLPD